MKPIFMFVVVSTSATSALLVAMGSRGMGLIVCIVAVGMHQWFRWADTTRKIADPRTDEQHDAEDSRQPATLPVVRHTTGAAATDWRATHPGRSATQTHRR